MTTSILVIDYGAGNLRSVLNSVRSVADTFTSVELCSDPRQIVTADRIILPGVGTYHECMNGLKRLDGMVEALTNFAQSGRPFLGICVGMQLLVDEGEEQGIKTKGLGWIQGQVKQIKPKNTNAKIPHMGWNTLQIESEHPILNSLDGKDVYFVHSYSAQNVLDDNIVSTTDYYGNIVAAIANENIIGLQFHPEKSQQNGLKILSNFLDWNP